MLTAVLRARHDFLGCIADPAPVAGVEDRPLSASPLSAGFPSGFDSGAPHVIPVNRSERYQVGPSCGGNTGARMVEVLSDAVGHPVPEISGAGVWWLARERASQTLVLTGTYMRSVMESLAVFGAPTREDWPEDTPFDRGPSLLARENAYDLRTTGFYRLSGERTSDVLDEVELAVRWDHPVGVGFDADAAYMNHVQSEDAVLTAPSGHIFGGHANMVHGVRGRGLSREFLLENWWPLFTRVWVDASFIIACRDPWCLTMPPKPF